MLWSKFATLGSIKFTQGPKNSNRSGKISIFSPLFRFRLEWMIRCCFHAFGRGQNMAAVAALFVTSQRANSHNCMFLHTMLEKWSRQKKN